MMGGGETEEEKEVRVLWGNVVTFYSIIVVWQECWIAGEKDAHDT